MIVDQWCVYGESRDYSIGNDNWSMKCIRWK